MSTIALSTLSVLGFSTFLTVAGVGSAFIVVPLFYWLGVPLPVAMSTGLLLNTISMVFASGNNARNGFISYRTAIPITILATLLSPIGVYCSRFVKQGILLWFFALFLVFAALMMLFYRPRSVQKRSGDNPIFLGGIVGAFAGFVGGLLGVGGGNVIIPVLVWRGLDPRQASGTTAFVVMFSSLSGFLSRANLGQLDYQILLYVSAASVVGGLIGSWLIKRLNGMQMKIAIAAILLLVSLKIMWGLI